jgi:hypothetical protein
MLQVVSTAMVMCFWEIVQFVGWNFGHSDAHWNTQAVDDVDLDVAPESLDAGFDDCVAAPEYADVAAVVHEGSAPVRDNFGAVLDYAEVAVALGGDNMGLGVVGAVAGVHAVHGHANADFDGSDAVLEVVVGAYEGQDGVETVHVPGTDKNAVILLPI